jgi:hypothetical protein
MEVYDMRRRMVILAILYGCPDDSINAVVDRAMARKNLTLATAGDYIAQSMAELNVRDIHLSKRERKRRPPHREKEPLSYE